MSKHEEIKKVAYEIFEKSGRTHGSDLDHWFEAERIVHERRMVATPPAEEAQVQPASDTPAPAEEKKIVRTRRKTAAEKKPAEPKKTKEKTATKTTRRKKTE